MSRVIKFRAWFRNEMIDNAIIFNESLYWNNEDSNGHHRLKYEKDYSIMQFTGLLDCNGAEIFEGDVVRYSNSIECGIAEVKAFFDTSSLHFEWIESEGFTDFYTSIDFLGCASELEIIGNVHQQPELLK